MIFELYNSYIVDTSNKHEIHIIYIYIYGQHINKYTLWKLKFVYIFYTTNVITLYRCWCHYINCLNISNIFRDFLWFCPDLQFGVQIKTFSNAKKTVQYSYTIEILRPLSKNLYCITLLYSFFLGSKIGSADPSQLGKRRRRGGGMANKEADVKGSRKGGSGARGGRKRIYGNAGRRAGGHDGGGKRRVYRTSIKNWAFSTAHWHWASSPSLRDRMSRNTNDQPEAVNV